MGRRVSGRVFLTVERDYNNPLRLTPVKVTSSYPRALSVDQVVIVLRVDVPASAFDALVAPDVVIQELQENVEVTPV